VQSIKTLIPGKYWVFKTQKTMSEAFQSEDERPVDLFASNKNSKYRTNSTDTHSLLPVQSPPNESDNLNTNRELIRMKNALTKRVNAHKLERKKNVRHVSKARSVVMNELPNFGTSSNHFVDRLNQHTSRKDNKHCDDFAEEFKELDYLTMQMERDRTYNGEYTTIDLDKVSTCLHKKIIRRYGKNYVNLLEQVGNGEVVDREVGDGEESFVMDTDSILNDQGSLVSAASQSHHFNQEKYQCEIINHTGPLKNGQDGYLGSRYNVTIEWYGGSLEEKPLWRMTKDAPKLLAQYAIDFGLTDEIGWKMPEVQACVREILKETNET
jgi:hypothetical protein